MLLHKNSNEVFVDVSSPATLIPSLPPRWGQVTGNIGSLRTPVIAVSAFSRNNSCIFYNYTLDGFCKGIITSLYVFGNQTTIAYGERETKTFQSYFHFFEISEKCSPMLIDFVLSLPFSIMWYHSRKASKANDLSQDLQPCEWRSVQKRAGFCQGRQQKQRHVLIMTW